MNLEREKENFKNHVATLTDLGNIKILDFANPNSSDYRIRFLFEEDYCTLHISGDLGDLSATNYNNMTFSKFKAFLRSPYYFMEKVRSHSRALEVFDEQVAREQLKEKVIANDWIYAENEEEFEEELEKFFEDVFMYFSTQEGVGPHGFTVISEHDDDAWEWAYDLGKVSSGIVELYLLAFELAMAQIEK